MKKVILLVTSMLACIFILVSFSTKKKTISIVTKPTAGIINCLPPAPTLITAAAFKAKYEPLSVKVRKNVDVLTSYEINAIKTGITKMKALPYTDPTSWLYQAAIHGTTLTDNLPSWNSCHKAGEGFFFLAWHRMYCYFFERILRAKSGKGSLTLPYWDYQTDPVLNAAYRDNSAGNPLYDASRNPAVNSGGVLPTSILTAFGNALNFIPYYDFQYNLGGPHGSVHTTVNGNMASVSTAAKDPVFWLHHANIDRLWEEWLRKCSGRANPVDDTWLNKTFTFFDENGAAVSMKGSQVVKIATQLNYRYDDMSSSFTCPSSKGSFSKKVLLIKKASPVKLKGQNVKASFTPGESGMLESYIRTNNKTNFNFSSRTTPDKLVLTFDGIKIDQMPQGVVEVYLNLPPGETPVCSSKHFVGLLDLFSAEHHLMHPARRMEDLDQNELDASKVAQALGLTLADLKKAEVSFYVRGCTLKGKEVKTEAQLMIQQIQFYIAQFKN